MPAAKVRTLFYTAMTGFTEQLPFKQLQSTSSKIAVGYYLIKLATSILYGINIRSVSLLVPIFLI